MRIRHAIAVLLFVLPVLFAPAGGPSAAAGGRSEKPVILGRPDRLAQGTLTVDEAGVRIEREGTGVRVTVPVSSSGQATIAATLSARLATLDDEPVTEWAAAALDIEPGLNEASVRLPAVTDWTWDHPAGTVIAWSLRVESQDAVLEGRKATGASQEKLRLLVSLPPRLVAGEPTPFQATVTREDGTAAAGATLRIRSGWIGGLEGAFAADAPRSEFLFDGPADASGVVSGAFTYAGGAAAAWFTLEAHLDGRRAVISETLTFEEPSPAPGRLVLTTDKPLYQPSQDVRVRVLALRPGDGRPAAGEILTHVVRDPKGTIVFREDLDVDRFGVTHFTFPLADELLFGNYSIEISGTDFSGQAGFTVDRYDLPRFSPRVGFDEPFVAPGGRLRGRVNLSYVFGEPVRGATVVVDLLRNAGDAEPQDSDSMRTRADGTAEFSLTVPPHFDAHALREGTAAVHVRVRAVDRAEQAAETVRKVPVSDGPLTIRLVAESAVLVTGQANVLHVAVSDPGGRPVEAQVRLSADGALLGAATTDARGYARILTTPLGRVSAIVATASTTDGERTASREFPFAPGAAAGFLLARPDAAIARVGEPLAIDLIASEDAVVATV